MFFDEIHQTGMLQEKMPQSQIQHLSHVMAELNIIHPFREGNSRSICELIRCMTQVDGITLNWGNADQDTKMDAAIASVYDDMAFCEILYQCFGKWGNVNYLSSGSR